MSAREMKVENRNGGSKLCISAVQPRWQQSKKFHICSPIKVVAADTSSEGRTV
jgi:hypothetical protein